MTRKSVRTMKLPDSGSGVPVEGVAESRPLIRLPLWKMSTLLLGAPKLVLFAAAGLAVLMYPEHWRSVVASEFWAAVSLYTGVVVGILFLWQYRPRPAAGWRGLVNLSRGIRVATTVSLAFTFSWIFHFRTSAHFRTSGPFFWLSILIATVLILVTDLLVVNKALAGTIDGDA